jgi:hypothetical protein
MVPALEGRFARRFHTCSTPIPAEWPNACLYANVRHIRNSDLDLQMADVAEKNLDEIEVRDAERGAEAARLIGKMSRKSRILLTRERQHLLAA